MSVCQGGHADDDRASDEAGSSTRDLHKQKPASKVVRVLTVLAYLLSVSLAAILLSIYYVCVWNSPDPPPLNRSEVSALRGTPTNYGHTKTYNITGGGHTKINGTNATQPADNAVDLMNTSTVDEAATTLVLSTKAPSTVVADLHDSPSDDIGIFNETEFDILNEMDNIT